MRVRSIGCLSHSTNKSFGAMDPTEAAHSRSAPTPQSQATPPAQEQAVPPARLRSLRSKRLRAEEQATPSAQEQAAPKKKARAAPKKYKSSTFADSSTTTSNPKQGKPVQNAITTRDHLWLQLVVYRYDDQKQSGQKPPALHTMLTPRLNYLSANVTKNLIRDIRHRRYLKEKVAKKSQSAIGSMLEEQRVIQETSERREQERKSELEQVTRTAVEAAEAAVRLQRERDALEVETIKLGARTALLASECKRLKADVNERDAAVLQSKTALEKLTVNATSVSRTAQESSNSKAEMKKLKSKIREQERQLHELKTRLASEEQEAAAMRQQTSSNSPGILDEQATQKLHQAEARNAELSSALAPKLKELNGLKSQLKEMKKLKEELNAERTRAAELKHQYEIQLHQSQVVQEERDEATRSLQLFDGAFRVEFELRKVKMVVGKCCTEDNQSSWRAKLIFGDDKYCKCYIASPVYSNVLTVSARDCADHGRSCIDCD